MNQTFCTVPVGRFQSFDGCKILLPVEKCKYQQVCTKAGTLDDKPVDSEIMVLMMTESY